MCIASFTHSFLAIFVVGICVYLLAITIEEVCMMRGGLYLYFEINANIIIGFLYRYTLFEI